MPDHRKQLRTTFDAAADSYQQARPEYPEQLYDALVEAAGIRVGDRLLEIGCATGKATIPLARRGFRITAIEIGPELAAVARHNLAQFRDVEIVEGAFETSAALCDGHFDVVFAATAWHWMDPSTRYLRAWQLLRPGGHLAHWSASHVIPHGGDPFFEEIQHVYEEIGEGMPDGWVPIRPGQLPDSAVEMEESGLFDIVALRQFDWEIAYDADQYLALLDTFSGHIAMEASKRDHLYAEIRRRLAQRPDGRLRRHWGAVLQVGRRTDRSRSRAS